MQKHVNLVDLVKSFPTSIYLQKSAWRQPRKSPSKFRGKFNALFIHSPPRSATSPSSACRRFPRRRHPRHRRPSPPDGSGASRGAGSQRSIVQVEKGVDGLLDVHAHCKSLCTVKGCRCLLDMHAHNKSLGTISPGSRMCVPTRRCLRLRRI